MISLAGWFQILALPGIHRMDNESDIDTCVTLHCYFPPYLFVNVYDERTGLL